MSDFEKRLNEKERFIPDEGFNLVGVDTFEDPGEELFLIGNYATKEEAEKERKNRLKDNPDERFYIYEPE